MIINFEEWNLASEMPDNDRTVQIAYEDGSTNEKCLGFVDEIDQIPPTGIRIWWELWPSMHISKSVAYWKERDKQ